MESKKVSWGPSGIWYKIVRTQTAITRSQTAISGSVSRRDFVGKESFLFVQTFVASSGEHEGHISYISTNIGNITCLEF